MKTTFLALFLHCSALLVFGQEVLEKVIVEKQTAEPVSYAYVYLNDEAKTGTLSNAEGHFRLEIASDGDTLTLSHIGYQPFKAAVTTLTSDTIFLEEKTLTLEEVPIYDLDGLAILQKMRDNLKENHRDDDMLYDVFLRSMYYREDRSVFHTLAEYSLEAQPQFPLGLKVNITHTRVKHFGEEVRNNHSEASLFMTHENFNLLPKVSSKSIQKKYSIELAGTSFDDSRTLLHVHFTPIEPTDPEMTLFLDKETYALTRRLISHDEKGIYADTRFKEVGGKWYLSYHFQRNTGVNNFDPGHLTQSEVIILYELAPQKRATKEFVSFLKLGFRDWEQHVGDWNDPFWEQFRSIPLPGWIEEIVGA